MNRLAKQSLNKIQHVDSITDHSQFEAETKRTSSACRWAKSWSTECARWKFTEKTCNEKYIQAFGLPLFNSNAIVSEARHD